MEKLVFLLFYRPGGHLDFSHHDARGGLNPQVSERAAMMALPSLIYGSSRFTGKCCFYLQKEVVVIPVAVGHPLDHLDLVVHSLQHTGVQPVDRAGDNAVDVALEAPGKLLHGGQPTTHS